jgi:hypothetical protein
LQPKAADELDMLSNETETPALVSLRMEISKTTHLDFPCNPNTPCAKKSSHDRHRPTQESSEKDIKEETREEKADEESAAQETVTDPSTTLRCAGGRQNERSRRR